MNSFSFAKSKDSSEKQLSRGFGWRYFMITFVLVGIVSLGVAIQMYRWQVVHHLVFSEAARTQYVQDRRLPTSRGTIYAADGSVLAVDEPLWTVYASVSGDTRERERFESQQDHFISEVSRILGLEPEEVNRVLTDDFRYVLLKRDVGSIEKEALEKEKLFGLYFETEEKRMYPHGSLACHVLGFVGKDENGEDVGNYGLEGYYSGDLLGVEGFQYEEKDSRGNVILTGEYDPVYARSGKNIVLTIRPGLQMRVEELLEKNVKEHEAKSGSVIVMDPNTGAILAMANYPKFNPVLYFRETDASVFRNKAISDVYEYGSVNKVLTLSMALEEDEITPETICSDNEGFVEVADKKIYTWNKRPSGDLYPKDILKLSNNVCAVKTGQKVGIERMHRYLAQFGIGDFIGIGLQDEATSYLPPLEKWNVVDLATASFGQSISATALQVVSAISTVANEGVRMRPYIVQRIYDDKEDIVIGPEVAAEVISKETADEVADMMEVVVKEGDPAWWFRELSNYSIAGKTGTAQIPYEDRAGYHDDRTNVTFVGFSPVHDAKMIMIVRLEEPKSHTLSAYTVVPTWVDIFKGISLDLGIVPDN